MQTSSAELLTLIKQGLAINAKPQLIAEWNQNRYAGIEEVDNVAPEYEDGYDVEYYPIDSIADPLRPSKRGIAKARAGIEGVISSVSDIPTDIRYYTSSVDDVYNYWSSPVASTDMTTFYGFTIETSPYILYTNECWSNKLYACFETSAASPANYYFDITTDGTTWEEVAVDIAPNSNGQVAIYRQADNSWSTTVYRDNPIQLKGVRLRIVSIDTLGAYLELIELSARLERDLTSTLMSSSSDFTMSETSFVTPLGNASSNTASIVLSNVDGTYNNTNADSMFYGIIDKNVKFTYTIGFDTTPAGGSGYEYITEYTMFSDSWKGQGEETSTVDLKDASKFLQEIKPPKILFEQMTIGRIVWQLCDLVGFNDYNYDKTDDDASTLIPYFWTDGEKTLWEIFSSIAATTQSAIYFDEFGILQILTRDKAYDLSAATAWQLNGLVDGSTKADIIDLTQSADYESNNVTIKYTKTAISDDNGRTPVMDIAWQPEDDVVLRSSQLRETMTNTQTFVRMTASEAAVWPYTGIIEIEGEIMSYATKGYWYYNLSNVHTFAEITSADEKKNIDENLSSPTLAFKNAFSGYFGGVVRGLWNTNAVYHYNDADGYTKQISRIGASPKAWSGGFVWLSDQSILSLRSTDSFLPYDFNIAKRGLSGGGLYWYYGTRLRFRDSGYKHGASGVCFNLGTNNRGYYLELVRTDRLTVLGGRKKQNEINFYVRDSSGGMHRFGPDGGKGAAFAVSKNTWYDIDISIRMQNGSFDESDSTGHVIQVSVNGTSKMTFTIPEASTLPFTGTFGLFNRGNSQADFEYLYSNGTTEDLHIDTNNFFDRIRGGIVSGQPDRDWIWGWIWLYRLFKKASQPILARFQKRFFDEFGPICHEVREFDVTYDKYPAVHSNIYFSNNSQIVCPEYKSDPFGAQFILANASRNNAVVNGEDTLTYGTDNPITQKLMIYGRTVNKADETTVVVKDDDAIRRRGSVETEIQPEWLQTEDSATALGDWIVLHWAAGNDEVDAEIFGNPLIQLSDIVSVNYPQKDFSASTHKYFVVKIGRSFDEGYESTKLTLRRVKQ
jgi:hypothetical protein